MSTNRNRKFNKNIKVKKKINSNKYTYCLIFSVLLLIAIISILFLSHGVENTDLYESIQKYSLGFL